MWRMRCRWTTSRRPCDCVRRCICCFTRRMPQIDGSADSRTVAVTGASGYIGSVLLDRLAARSLNILRISRLELAPRAGMQSLTADIKTSDCWRAIVESADVIFHLAGNTSVYAAADNPAESLMSTVLPI